MEDVIYFIEHNEDSVAPRASFKSLVEKYVDMMKNKDIHVETFKTKAELNEGVIEQAKYNPRHGVEEFEEYTYEEMEKMIKEAEEWY